MLVLNITNFQAIEDTGRFDYNMASSRLPGNPGETNVTVDPGIYWFFVSYHGSATGVDLRGEQVGGYMIQYFGLKGQDF